MCLTESRRCRRGQGVLVRGVGAALETGKLWKETSRSEGGDERKGDEKRGERCEGGADGGRSAEGGGVIVAGGRAREHGHGGGRSCALFRGSLIWGSASSVKRARRTGLTRGPERASYRWVCK